MEHKRMTQDEWTRLGQELFGEDMTKWRFKCPVCGHVQTPEDFRQFKDAGATPSSAYSECIGRYFPKEDVREAFGEPKKRGRKKIEQPCNYAGYGLIRLGPVVVETSRGGETIAFEFAEPDKEETDDGE